MVFAVQMHEPTLRAGRIPYRIPPYKREAGGSNPPAPTKFSQLDGLFGTLIGDSGTMGGNHPVHAPWREACLAAMATSPSTALSARDASNRRERSSTVRCATEPKIGDAPGKPVTMSNLRLWAPAHTAAAMCCILFAPMAGCAAPELADLCAYGRRVMPN